MFSVSVATPATLVSPVWNSALWSRKQPGMPEFPSENGRVRAPSMVCDAPDTMTTDDVAGMLVTSTAKGAPSWGLIRSKPKRPWLNRRGDCVRRA